LVAARPRFPRPVQRLLVDRRLRLLANVDVDVLDLSSPAARARIVAAGKAEDGRDPLEGTDGRTRYRAIVSVAELVRFPDVVLALRGIDRLLADDGDLWLVEPVHHTGSAATLLASLWSNHPAVAGVHVERDVADAVRAVGLTLTDLERFAMPTTVYPLRLFIQARARRVVDAHSEGRAA
jgi:hypothetical protein